MAVVRLEPFRDLLSIQERMNRMFDAAYRFSGSSDQEAWGSGGGWVPLVDIYEKDGKIFLSVELPGVDPKGVDIRLEHNVLTLSGERQPASDVDKGAYHRMGRSYGSFSRSFSLPAAVDQGKIGADYKDGMLTVTLPRRKETLPKQIRINVGG